MFEIYAKNDQRDVSSGKEEKIRFGSALFTQFWHCKHGFVYYSNVQRTFKDGKIKSTVFTRPHAMKRHKSQVNESYVKGTVPAPIRSSNLLKRLRKIFAMPVRPRSVTEIRYNIIFPP